FFLFNLLIDHLDLHSFPTRRSSDLSKTSRCSPSWQSVTLICVSRPVSRSKAVWTLMTMPWGPKHFQWVPSTSKMRLNPPRTRHEIGRATRLNSSHLVISYAVFCLKK